MARKARLSKAPVPDRLLDAAAELLAERGFGRATVAQIAARADCAAGSLYNHFADKDDLLGGLLQRLQELEGAKVDLGDVARADFRAFVRAWVRHRAEAMAASEELLRGLLAEMLVRPELRRRYRDEVLEPRLAVGSRYLERVAERGQAEVDEPDLASRVLLAGVLGLVLLRLLGEPGTTDRWKAVCDTLADVFLEGLAGDRSSASSAAARTSAAASG